MEDTLALSRSLDNQLQKLQYVIQEVIAYNKSCFVDPLTSQVDSYQVKKVRCFRLMKALEDQSQLDQLQITLDNVSKQLLTLTHSGLESWRQWMKDHNLTEEIDATALELCLKQVQVSVESVGQQYPNGEWIDE